MNWKDIDPATATNSPELVALIAEEWMGWSLVGDDIGSGWYDADRRYHPPQWNPFDDPAHAGEARRKARYSSVTHNDYKPFRGVSVTVFDGQTEEEGECRYAENNGDKAHAEALATCRAILAAMKARAT